MPDPSTTQSESTTRQFNRAAQPPEKPPLTPTFNAAAQPPPPPEKPSPEYRLRPPELTPAGPDLGGGGGPVSPQLRDKSQQVAAFKKNLLLRREFNDRARSPDRDR